MLENDNEDMIISTACLASPLSQMIMAGDESGAQGVDLMDMKDLVGDRLWLESCRTTSTRSGWSTSALVNLA